MHTGTYMGIAATVITLFISCKKANNNQEDNTSDDEGCVTQLSVKSSALTEDQYIIVYKEGTGTTDRAVETESLLLKNSISKSAIQKTFDGAFNGCLLRATADKIAALQKDERIAWIEPDRIIKLGNCFTVVEPRLITWNINKVGYGNGIGKTAWVIDTGIDFEHPDLNVDKTRSRSFISGQTSADDQNGHGTHVAGIIGGLNNTFGVLGVASGASLVALKVLDSEGEGNLSAILSALNYVGKNAKTGDVVNMSLGLEGGSAILDQQVKTLAAKGILFAIAAGNDAKEANEYSPARVNAPNVFTVSAIDSLDRFAGFSNYGNDVVDVAAPGVRIISTYLNGRYARLSGTSMAAPHVAGLLLLNGANLHNAGFARNDPDGIADMIAGK